MEQSTVTLVVGLAGIASTLIVSSMGLYYTAKSRVAPLRQEIFSKQIEMAIEVIHLQSRIRVFATILSSEESPFLEKARHDIGEYFRKFTEAEEKAAVIFPVELWVEIRILSDEISNAIDEFDSQGVSHKARMKTLIARITKVALLARTVIGSDELSEQAINLFSSRKAYARVADLKVTHFEKIYSQVNEKEI